MSPCGCFLQKLSAFASQWGRENNTRGLWLWDIETCSLSSISSSWVLYWLHCSRPKQQPAENRRVRGSLFGIINFQFASFPDETNLCQAVCLATNSIMPIVSFSLSRLLHSLRWNTTNTTLYCRSGGFKQASELWQIYEFS